MRLLLLSLVFLAVAPAADLDTVKAEPDLEKRSERALDLAIETLSAARAAYSDGEYKKAMTDVSMVEACVELAYESLQQSGKSPRKSKYFKRAEMKTRRIFRRLDEFAHEAAIDDRPLIEKAGKRVSQIHDELLSGILERKS